MGEHEPNHRKKGSRLQLGEKARRRVENMKCKKAGAKSPLRFADIIGPAKAVPLLQSAFN
jgi:hypothetical protein